MTDVNSNNTKTKYLSKLNISKEKSNNGNHSYFIWSEIEAAAMYLEVKLST